MFYNTESAKDKTLEADPNLERSMTFVRAWKIHSVYILSYMARSWQGVFKLLLILFFTKK